MNAPARPINAIVPPLPPNDRSTLVRPAGHRPAIFTGWGPKI